MEGREKREEKKFETHLAEIINYIDKLFP